jgi:flavin-dependent dehydrogenase
MAITPKPKNYYDVVIIGAGLAGLTLSRQLLLYTNKSVLLIDRRSNPPREAPQKYGESLVQCSGYYFSRVLDLEEYLLIEHYLKYNLRFYWPTPGLCNTGFEDYSQSYIRKISNIATFQLDRNALEEHLLKINTAGGRCEFTGGVMNLGVDLSVNGSEHRVYWSGGQTCCRWVVDASGRGQLIKRKLELRQQNPIRHGATFFWVEGLVNIEKITGKSHREILYNPQRQNTGQFPFFLATNHFCGEGQWFWVIPLHHKTSLGLVYDRNVVPLQEVSSTKKTIDYVCRHWPMFARDLPQRKIVDEGRLIDFSHDCKQTISPKRWALVGEAGRFTDPLYSPGSDLIGIYNTLITDAIQTENDEELQDKCRLAEQIQRVMYESYVPSYATSYDCLGDQEAFNMKYTWELAVYFGFVVLPMINGFYANAEFMPQFLRRYAVLGAINHNLQRTLSAFFQWKKKQRVQPVTDPSFFEFYDMKPLEEAESLFYQTGLTPRQAIEVLDRHLERLQEFALYILTHIHASVIGDRKVLTNARFIATLKIRNTNFDPESMRGGYAHFAAAEEQYKWNLNPFALERYILQRTAEEVSA